MEGQCMLLAFNDCELDTRLFLLRCGGQPRLIEPQVFNVLVYLAQNQERIVSRQELLDNLWQGKVVSESTLSSCIKAARQAIGDNGQSQSCIATLSRRGYRFVAMVEEREQITSRDNEVAEKQMAHLLAPRLERPSLAVLPFSCSPGNDKLAWTAQILSEDISIQLARIPGFLVISRNSTAYYSGREYNISQVGQELGAHYIVEGSIYEKDQHLRVSVQLLESASGRLLWANRTEVPADRLEDYQDDVVREIVGRIEPELNRAEFTKLRQRRPVDLGAWDLYRKAHTILGIQGWREESFSESAALLRQAIARDPELAFAHAYLALILAIGHLLGLVSDDGCCDEAMVAAETALALDSQDSDVLGYVGCAFADMGDVQRGVGIMQRAVELDPSNAQAHSALGAAMLRLGKVTGIDMMRYGIRISPRDNRLAAWGALLARGLLKLGKTEEAIEAAEHACSYDDKMFLPRLVLAVAQITAKRPDAARDALDDARRIRPQLSVTDIARIASQDEIENLRQAGLFSLCKINEG
jgi:TolB-like protein